MAFFDSQLAVFKITDVTPGTLRDVSAYINGIDGLPGPRELNDATTLNQAGAKWHPSLERVAVTLELLFSKDALVGSDTVFGPLRTHTAAVAFEYYPAGTTAGCIKYTGSVWVKTYTTQVKVGQIVTGRVELQVDGVVTRGTV